MPKAPEFGVSTMPVPPKPSPVALTIEAAMLALLAKQPH